MAEFHNIGVDGGRLLCEVGGEGAPLVLVHGLASDMSAWDELWDALTQSRRVVRYDLRGYGRSAQFDLRPFRHSEDLGQVLDALEIERAAVLGASMGGSIALNFALDHPDRVTQLALVSPGMVAWDWSDAWRASFAEILQAAQSGELAKARALWFGHPLFATTRSSPHAAARLKSEIDSYSGRHWTDGDAEAPQMPDIDRLPFLAPPTLLLSGAEDLPDFQLIADLITGAAREVRRIDYPGAGHLLHYEQPQAVLCDLLTFLA